MPLAVTKLPVVVMRWVVNVTANVEVTWLASDMFLMSGGFSVTSSSDFSGRFLSSSPGKCKPISLMGGPRTETAALVVEQPVLLVRVG